MIALTMLKPYTKSFVLRIYPLVCLALASQAAATPHLDQSQTRGDYGFWFDREVQRWQEFAPSIPNLTGISILVSKRGNPGNLTIELTDRSFQILFRTTLADSSVPNGTTWVQASLPEPVRLDTETLYRIRVYSDRISTDPTERYFWAGSNTNNYGENARSSVYSAWQNFDFAFITYAIPDPVDVSALPLPAIKAALDRRKQ